MYRRLLFLTVAFVLIFPTYAWESSKPLNDNLPTISVTSENFFSSYSTELYQKINDKDLNFEAFTYALKGYLKLKSDNILTNAGYLTIVDMSVSANVQRFFLINMETLQLETKSFVAHGRSTGLEYAKKFSNIKNSHQTSLGFYKTAETYIGKHGFSLRLDGLEYSNSNARARAIVIHEADYASAAFIKKNGRLGRSFGCPSLPKKDYRTIINKIKQGSCLFIYYPEKTYLKRSKLANVNTNIFTDA